MKTRFEDVTEVRQAVFFNNDHPAKPKINLINQNVKHNKLDLNCKNILT